MIPKRILVDSWASTSWIWSCSRCSCSCSCSWSWELSGQPGSPPQIEQDLAEALDVSPNPGTDGVVQDERAAASPEFWPYSPAVPVTWAHPRTREDCRPRITWWPLALAGSPVFPPCVSMVVLTKATRRYHGRTCFSPFPSLLRVPRPEERCLHTRRFGDLSRVCRRLLKACVGDTISLATFFLQVITNGFCTWTSFSTSPTCCWFPSSVLRLLRWHPEAAAANANYSKESPKVQVEVLGVTLITVDPLSEKLPCRCNLSAQDLCTIITLDVVCPNRHPWSCTRDIFTQ